MNYTTKFLIEAEADIDSIVDFIAKDSVFQAEKYYNCLMSKINNLQNMPLLGRKNTIKKYAQKGYREYSFCSHIVHYKVDDANKSIIIIRVLHHSMKMSKHLI